MKTQIQKTHRVIGTTLLGLLLFAGFTVRAADITQTLDQTAGNNWNATASWGTPAEVATAGNNYFTPAGLHVRTQDTATEPQTFVGDSLTIETGGILWLKHIIEPATVNLIMNGGEIEFHGSSAIAPSPLAGTIQVLLPSFLGTDQGAAQASDIWLQSDITGSGSFTVNMTAGVVTNNVIITGDNSGYSGDWITSAGGIEIGSGTANPLGSGSVTLTDAAHSLIFNATNDLTVANAISGAGSVVKLNTNNTVTLGGDNPGLSGSVRVVEGVLKIQDATAISSAQLALEGGTLDATLLGGLVLNDVSAQTMRCNGTVAGGLEAKSGTTLNFDLGALTNDVLNVSGGSLTLTGNPNLSLSLVGFKAPGTYRLINYEGTIQGGGSFNLLPPDGSSQMFTLDTSTSGQVNVTISGDPRDLVWVGNGFDNYWSTDPLDFGNWTDGGAPTIFAQGDNVTFNDSGSDTPDINVYSGNPPTLFTVGNMTVDNSTKAYTFTFDAITSTSALIKRGSNIVAFANDGNNFSGPITIEEGTLSIGNGSTNGSLGSGDIVNNGILMMNKSENGAALTGTISGTGDVISTGGGTALDLWGTNTYTGLTIASDFTEIIIRNNDSLGSPSTGTIVTNGGSVRFVSLGNYTIAEPLTLSGPGPDPATPGALYANSVGNVVTWTGPITIAGTEDTRIRVVNDNVTLTLANTVTGNDTPLWCTAASPGDLMTFADVLNIGAGALTTDGVGTTVLAATGNIAGSTAINGGSLLVDGDLNGGSVAVNSSGTLGGTGTVFGPVTVGNNGSIAPGNAGIGTLTLNSTLTLAASSVMRMEINPANGQNADLLVASSVPLNGTLEVVNVGPTPQLGDTFNLIDGTISGSFAGMNLPKLAPPLIWDDSQLGTSGVLTVGSNSLPVLPFEITDLQVPPGSLEVTWNSYPGQVYDLEYSFDAFSWQDLANNIPADPVTNHTSQSVSTVGGGVGFDVLLAQYQMTSTNAEIQDPVNLVGAGPLTQGAGISYFAVPASLGYPTDPVLQVNQSGTSPDLASSIANQAWFTFDITVGSSVTDLDLTSLTFLGARGGGATPRGYGVLVTTPTTTDEQVGGPTDFTTQRPTMTLQDIDLSGVASLQNLTAGQVITFKIAYYSPSNGNSGEFDNITVSGNITPGPDPVYGGADQLFIRASQQ